MTKVFLLILLTSSPNWPSVKHNAFLYATDTECHMAQTEYLNLYEKKDNLYKSEIKTDAYCLEFESFNIPGLNKINLGI